MKRRWADPAYRARLSERHRELWADPEWRAQQTARIAEGNAIGMREGRIPGPKPKMGAIIGHHIQISARIDKETYLALRRLTEEQSKSLSELIRTYVEWGLEQEKL